MKVPRYYFERALFIVGEQDSGKSTQLRSLFLDVRFGCGTIPDPGNLMDIYRISNERSLYLRMTSPHEKNEHLKNHSEEISFLNKTEEKIDRATPHYGRRWNFASPLQPNKSNNMPDVVETVREFYDYFNPERIRVLFLSPDYKGNELQNSHLVYAQALIKIPSVEVAWINACSKVSNGLLIADFFDFT